MEMKKMLLCLAAMVILMSSICLPIHAADRDIPVYIGGRTVEGVLMEDTTFVPFDIFCYEMGADAVTWNPETNVVSAFCHGITIASEEGASYVEANGRCFYTGPSCRSIDGMLYVPVRALAKAFDAEVIWNGDDYTVDILDRGGICESGDTYYWDGAVMWLSRIMYAEANTEPLTGKIAVGNVIMNRVKSPEFPDTIYSVIFDRKYGVQFTPVANGSVYNNANEECERAAKMVLEGATVSEEALYFMNVAAASNLWVQNNREYLFTIGKHSFYR